MAKLISPLFSQVKGSIGYTTFYNTTDNPICGRSRVMPFNPRSSNQLTSRQSFMDAVASWPLLSAGLRDDYHALATTLKTNFPALVKTANGRSLFLRLFSVQTLMKMRGLNNYSGYTNIDSSYIADSPQTSIVIGPLAGAGYGFTVWVYNYHGEDLRYIIEMSPAQRPVSYYFSGGFDWNASGSGGIDSAAGPGYPGTQMLTFATLTNTKVYYVRVRLMASEGQPCNWSSIPIVMRGVAAPGI
jgi:hypothetical protein